MRSLTYSRSTASEACSTALTWDSSGSISISNERLAYRDCAFSKESDLVSNFFDVIASQNTFGSTVFVDEFVGSDGIADLVGVKLRRDWRTQEQFRHIPPQWAYAFYLLPYRKAFPRALLERIAGVSASHAQGMLRLFVDACLCRKVKGKSEWIKVAQPRQIAVEAFAVEAKLADWKRALYQACRHTTYAEHSWVLLDEERSTPATSDLEIFRRRNIGLMTLSTSGNLRTHFSPLSRRPSNPIAAWRMNFELLRRLLSA
jgi:hypothetical protein